MAGSGFEIRRQENGTEHVVLIMGWGNDFDSPGIRWLVSKLGEANLSVAVVRIPVRIMDYHKEIIEPVQELSDELDGPIILAHSFGGVAGRYVETSGKRIFSSPYWGIPRHRRIPMMSFVLGRLGGLDLPVIPRGYRKEHLGDLTTDGDMASIPMRISLRTVSTVWKAQKDMPPPREDDTIYYSRSEHLSDLECIMDAPCRKFVYEGGHQFFTSGSRQRTFHDILYDLRRS